MVKPCSSFVLVSLNMAKKKKKKFSALDSLVLFRYDVSQRSVGIRENNGFIDLKLRVLWKVRNCPQWQSRTEYMR